jgi:anthranilate phosphoribosyltransferase
MIKEAISTLAGGDSLGFEESAAVMEAIMNGAATPAQIAAFLVALRFKGETVEEIAGLATTMRSRAVPVTAEPPLVDTCGTGGDGAGTFNISTAAAIVAAGAGARVAKHGNRAASSQCGSADVLEELGVKIDLGPAGVAACIAEIGIGFMLAPVFHPAMKHAAAPRREIGIRTVFNVLGPLANPARPQAQVIGVGERGLGEKLAAAVCSLGIERAFVVCGTDHLDEISVTGPTRVWEIAGGEVKTPYEITPGQFGFREAALEDIAGGTVAENAAILRRILDGEEGPRREATLLNAAAALVVGGWANDMETGIAQATAAIDRGRARNKMDDLIKLSQSLGENNKC